METSFHSLSFLSPQLAYGRLRLGLEGHILALTGTDPIQFQAKHPKWPPSTPNDPLSFIRRDPRTKIQKYSLSTVWCEWEFGRIWIPFLGTSFQRNSHILENSTCTNNGPSAPPKGKKIYIVIWLLGLPGLVPNQCPGLGSELTISEIN